MYIKEQEETNLDVTLSDEVIKVTNQGTHDKEKMSMKRLGIFFDRIEDSTPNYVLGYN